MDKLYKCIHINGGIKGFIKGYDESTPDIDGEYFFLFSKESDSQGYPIALEDVIILLEGGLKDE